MTPMEPYWDINYYAAAHQAKGECSSANDDECCFTRVLPFFSATGIKMTTAGARNRQIARNSVSSLAEKGVTADVSRPITSRAGPINQTGGGHGM